MLWNSINEIVFFQHTISLLVPSIFKEQNTAHFATKEGIKYNNCIILCDSLSLGAET